MKIEKRTDGWYVGDTGPYVNREKAREAKRLAKETGTMPWAPSTKAKAAKANRKAAARIRTAKRGRPAKGLVAVVHEAFAHGCTTPDAVVSYATEKGLNPSINTVRTQLGNLRREAGLTDKSKGPVNMIRTAFGKGHTTNAQIAKYLASRGVEASPNTIKTQAGRLRRESAQG